MRKRCIWTIVGLLFSLQLGLAQSVTVEGYVFEEGNRGYLNVAKVTLIETISQSVVAKSVTNLNGVFTAEVPAGQEFLVEVDKDLFETGKMKVSTVGKGQGQKVFVRIPMKRKPGYIFDVTIAEKQLDEEQPVDAVTNARIDVYNNTKEKEVMILENHPNPTFKTHFEDGNHYTILIRKKGYFNKRLEAFVNVEGCILCFEGVGNIRPSDVLTEGHEMGTLLANVELQPAEIGKGIKLENIYYDYNKSKIRDDAALELDKLITVLQNNPSMIVELGSHTDARGRDDYNLELSDLRAKAAAAYILSNSNIEDFRVQSKGYGETQILNKCKNGVNCSERSHQQNRRTELKIVGFLSEDPFSNRSLAQIIEDEKFAAKLAEVQSGEVIQVAEGEEMPDDLKKALEKQEREREEWRKSLSGKKSENTPSQFELEGQVPKPSAPLENRVANKPPRTTQPTTPKPKATTRPTTPKVSTSKPNTPANRPTDYSNTAGTSPTTSSNTGRRPFKPKLEVEPEPTTSTTPTYAEFDGEKNNDSRIISDLPEVGTAEFRPKAMKIPYNYSGYRVEFFVAPYELPESHEIFSKHGDLSVEQRKDGAYAYLMGDFADWRDANKFLTSIVLASYPDARVIRYKKGRRLVN